ncbi:unnamed protein product, partial [Rotaria magnacalcarata]
TQRVSTASNDENIIMSNNNKSNVQSESDVLQYIDNRVNQLNEKLISNSSKLDQLMQKLYVKIDRLTSNINIPLSRRHQETTATHTKKIQEAYQRPSDRYLEYCQRDHQVPPPTDQSPGSLQLFRPSSQEYYMHSVEQGNSDHLVPPPTDQSPGSLLLFRPSCQ